MRQEGIITSIRAIPAEEWGPGYRIWRATLSWLAQRGPDGTTSIVRVASHIVIIFVAMAVMWFSGLDLPRWDIAEAPASARLAEDQAANLAIQSNVSNSLLRSAVPRTLIPERQRAQILTHTVAANDTLTAIAAKYQISAETIIWANNLQENPDLLWLEQQLIILPVSGVLHTVGAGETIESIAQKYKANPADVARLEYNALDAKNPAITAGQKIVVPGGVKEEAPKPTPVPAPAPAPVAKAAPKAQAPAAPKPAAPAGPAPAAVGKFVWPASGAITQRYYSYHKAIDIGGKYRSPIKASDAGKVIVAGWSNYGYGNHVVVDHGNGYTTLYAHMDKITVSAGQGVERGEQLGLLGTTGRSTGPHLHFEIKLNGVLQNPFNYLP